MRTLARLPRLALAALTTAVLAGCAQTAAPVLPPGPPAGVEGRYRGTARLVRGDRLCPRSGPRVYQVVNGAVSLAYSAGGRARVTLTGDIQPNGTIRASDGVGTLDGQLTDGRLEITITSPQCEHHWTMQKVT
jgi:hypothetical protein